MAATTRRGLTPFYAVLGVIALAGVALLAYLAAGPGSAGGVPANVVVQPSDTAGFRGYVMGADTAPVEVVEYADYQCPACQGFATVQMPDIRRDLIATGRVRWRYRDFPLSQHRHARLAAHAAACADEQGKFWEMHDLIYAGQADWAFRGNAGGAFRDYARQLGLELGRYDGCMDSNRYAGRIQASFEEGQRIGVQSTPSFLIGGRIYAGALASDRVRQLVDSIASPGR
ncbi:MAG TPA: thioredoxin domain-containing protein [Gemmatimonadales bacterium]|nr:thioredoxin domain-containing protein [Gemmatimonadales bacterium]